MDRPFRIESGHLRCPGCKESDVYRRTDSGVEYTRLWQCCNCGYALNDDAINVDCSYCFLGSSAIGTYGEHWAIRDEFNLGWSENPTADDLDAAPHVICRHEPLQTADTESFPFLQDDLGSAVEQNVLCLEQFEAASDPRATFDYDPAFDQLGLTTLNSCEGNGLDVFTTRNLNLAFEKPYLQNSMATKDKGMLHMVQSQADTSGSGNFSACVKPCHAETCTDLDSGYGSQLNGYGTMSELRDTETEPPSDTSQSDSLTSIHSDRATHEQTEPEPLRLACPFYKRHPIQCKRNACTGRGYEAIGRLLEHLKRAHLYFQCARCGKTYPGERGERALERHVSSRSCEQQSIRAHWGFDYVTWKKIQSRKGVTGKSREERWRRIYMALFPDTAIGSVPLPCKLLVPSKQYQLLT